MRSQIIVLVAIGIISLQIYRIKGMNWKEGAPLNSLVDRTFKRGLDTVEKLPGIRLLFQTTNEFPLEELTKWDTLLGGVILSSLPYFLMWLTSPLPDILTNLDMNVDFNPRDPIHLLLEEEEDEELFPQWQLGAGEGPHNGPWNLIGAMDDSDDDE